MKKLIGAIAVALAAFGAAVHGQQPAVTAIPNISGLWNRLDPQGGGSYGGIDLLFPRAQLLPEAAAKLPPEQDQGSRQRRHGHAPCREAAQRCVLDASRCGGGRSIADSRPLQHRRRWIRRRRYQLGGHGDRRVSRRGRDRA